MLGANVLSTSFEKKNIDQYFAPEIEPEKDQPTEENLGLIIGVSLGVTALIGILILILYCMMCRKK